MGWFSRAWSNVKNVGKKMLGWGEKVQVVGQKAKKHYAKAHNIGQKVSKGYHYGRSLYDEARNLKSAEQAVDFVKREAGKADEYKREAGKVLQDARRLGRDVRQFAGETKASFGY